MCLTDIIKLEPAHCRLIYAKTCFGRQESRAERCVTKRRRNPTAQKKQRQLGYDSVFGRHVGERKTRKSSVDRRVSVRSCYVCWLFLRQVGVVRCIKLSFYWPGLKKSVRQYTASCKDCQLRYRKLTTDRVPIAPITTDDRGTISDLEHG